MKLAARDVAVIFFLLWTLTDCAKILVMVTVASPSLFNLFTPIIQELANRKHEVTTQSYFHLKTPLPNVKEMILPPNQWGNDENFTKALLFDMAKMHPIAEVNMHAEFAEAGCANYIKEETTQKLLTGGKQFDLVLVDGELACPVIVSLLLGKHTVGLIGCGNFPWLYSDVPAPPSYVPNYFRVRSSTMNFWERMENALEVAAFQLVNHYRMMPKEQKALSEHLPQSPPYYEAMDHVELMLTNGDPVMASPRPSMPNVINVGGLHVREAQALPKEMNDFVESAGDDGFIIFSLGTNMKSQFLSPEMRAAILSTFSRLKQKVIWKFEAKLENVPKNVLITKWLPQQDLLGHPKIRLFVTHSGLLSLQEAVYHGVPVIGIPFYMDQRGNIGRIKELGMGEHLDFFTITKEKFYNIIQKVLADKSYAENAKKYSAIFRDQPDKPIDRAIYWLEYVLRHGGARHFRPAGRDLNFFQYFLLDVMAFFILIVSVTIGVVVFVTKKLLAKVFPKKQLKGSLQKKLQ